MKPIIYTLMFLFLMNCIDTKLVEADGSNTKSPAYVMYILNWPVSKLFPQSSSGSGTGTGSVINLYYIGGTITGLTVSGLVLQNNKGDDLTIASGISVFTFSTKLSDQALYDVTIKNQPTGLLCSISNGSGIVNVSNVTAIIISCKTLTYSWGILTDNLNGTIKFEGVNGVFDGNTYTAQTLTWMKCSHGQTWNSTTNSCNGIASSVRLCSIAGTDNCYGGLGGNGLGNYGIAYSEAYSACNSQNSGIGMFGIKNWRVPTLSELKLLIECTNKTMSCGTPNYTSPTINSLFPNTPSSFYWSSSLYLGNGAYNVGLIDFNTGGASASGQTASLYVRCVSGP